MDNLNFSNNSQLSKIQGIDSVYIQFFYTTTIIHITEWPPFKGKSLYLPLEGIHLVIEPPVEVIK